MKANNSAVSSADARIEVRRRTCAVPTLHAS